MFRACLLGLSLLVAAPAAAEKPRAPESVDGAVTVSAEQTVELILANPQLVVIDARRDEEFAKGHIEGAVSLLDTAMTPEALAALATDRDTPLLFYCNGARCLRSSNAVRRALDWGYRTVYWFRGGWAEWMEKHLPVSR